MKLKLIFFSLLTVFVLNSCSNDDDTIPASNAEISGEWQLEEYSYTGTTTNTSGGVTLVTDFDAVASDIDYVITFQENPNVVTGQGSMTLILTTTVEGQEFQNEIPFDDSIGSSSWSYREGVITFEGEGQSVEAIVTELTDSTLEFEIETEQLINQGSLQSVAQLNVFYKLTR